jgi:ribose 5-phosphate isomerase RpiB
MKRSDFQRGAIAAASVAETYDSTSTHPYRLGDCILSKLNIRKAKPRVNRSAPRNERDAWLSGFAVALAEIHRQLLNGNNSTGICAAARGAGLTLASARAAGVSAFDLKELKKAGIP